MMASMSRQMWIGQEPERPSVQRMHVYVEQDAAGIDSVTKEIVDDSLLWIRPELPVPVDPAELDAAIVAQRDACREAGEAWETSTAEAVTAALTVAVYQRQAVRAAERAVMAQGAHQGALNELWRLEAQRDG